MKNKWDVLFGGLFYAAPFMAMILPIVIDSFCSNFEIFSLSLALICITWCGGMNNVRNQNNEDEIESLKKEIERLKKQ